MKGVSKSLNSCTGGEESGGHENRAEHGVDSMRKREGKEKGETSRRQRDGTKEEKDETGGGLGSREWRGC